MKNSHQSKLLTSKKSGFTIIETSLVTAFMALLMIAIATVTTSISALYRKGVTLKAVNSVGRNLITELTTTINSAPSIDSISLCNTLLSNDTARSNCLADNAYRYVFNSWENLSHTDVATGATGPVQYSGVLCTGDYSYVWNTHYGLDSAGQSVSVRYYKDTGSAAETRSDFKMLRFPDKTYLACSSVVDADNYQHDSGSHVIDMTTLKNGTKNIIHDTDFQTTFLENSDIDLILYELTIFPVSQDFVTLRSFFSGTFILATERGEVNVVRGGDYCNVDDFQGDTSSNLFDLGSEFNYCAINKFNFAARTAGSGV